MSNANSFLYSGEDLATLVRSCRPPDVPEVDFYADAVFFQANGAAPELVAGLVDHPLEAEDAGQEELVLSGELHRALTHAAGFLLLRDPKTGQFNAWAIADSESLGSEWRDMKQVVRG